MIDNGTTYMAMRTKKKESDSFTQTSVKINSNYYSCQDACVDVDHKGIVHLRYRAIDSIDKQDYSYYLGIYYTQSRDGGQSLEEPRKLTNIQVPVYSHGQSNNHIEGVRSPDPFPQIICDNSMSSYKGNIYLVWTADGLDEWGYNGNDIYFMRSTDGGTTWEKPVIINDDPKEMIIDQFHPCISVNPDGVVSIFWYDRRDDPQNNIQTNCYMAYSFDGGKSFTKNFKITQEYADFSISGLRNYGFSIGEYDHLVSTKGFAIPTWADGRTNDGMLNLYVAFVPITKNPKDGVEEIKVISTDFNFLSLFPNPASDNISINFQLTKLSKIKIDIINEDGAVISSIPEKQFTDGIFNIDYNLHNLKNVAFFCKITSYFGYSMKKFIINI